LRPTVLDLKLVRQLRDHISSERDPLKIRALCSLLASLIRENDAEIDLRLKFLKKKYSLLFDSVAPVQISSHDRDRRDSYK
jgi:hypothetical protein